MVVTDVQAMRASFCQKGIDAAKRALEMMRANAGDPAARERTYNYLLQAMYVCHHYAHSWQVVVDCALEAHNEMLRTGRWAQWTEYLEMAIDAGRHLEDRRAETTLLLHLGRMQFRGGEWSSARAQLIQVIVLSDETGDRQMRGRALTTLSDMERHEGRLDEAQRLIAQALESLEGTGDAQGLSDAYRGMGNLDLQRGRGADALTIYSKALEYATACGDLECLASIYHNIGTICAQHGEIRGTEVQYQHALELFRQTGDQSGEALTMSNIGLACQADRGYWRQAIETFHQVIALSRKAGYYQGEITALSYLIDILLKLGEVEQAAAATEHMRTLYTRTNSAYGLATAARYTGAVRLAQGDAKSALIYLQRAQESPEMSEDIEDMAQIQTDMGRAYAMLGAWEKAESAYKGALALWAEASELPGELETRLSLVELYRTTAAWEKLDTAQRSARLLAARIEREDALARLDAAAGDACFAAGQIEAGCNAYASALQRLIEVKENDRQAQCYQRIVMQAQAQINALEHASQGAGAAALRDLIVLTTDRNHGDTGPSLRPRVLPKSTQP